MVKGREFGFVRFSRMSRRMVRMMAKGQRRTINDAPLPKVNWYLSHICFFHFSNFLYTAFVFLHCMFEIFKIVFRMLEFFLALFPFYKKNTKNIFWVLKSFGKNNLDIFSEQTLAVHHIFKVYDHWGITWPKGGTWGPTQGPANPTGRPTQG